MSEAITIGTEFDVKLERKLFAVLRSNSTKVNNAAVNQARAIGELDAAGWFGGVNTARRLAVETGVTEQSVGKLRTLGKAIVVHGIDPQSSDYRAIKAATWAGFGRVTSVVKADVLDADKLAEALKAHADKLAGVKAPTAVTGTPDVSGDASQVESDEPTESREAQPATFDRKAEVSKLVDALHALSVDGRAHTLTKSEVAKITKALEGFHAAREISEAA